MSDGLIGTPDITIKTDGALWIDIVTGKRNPVFAVVTRRLKIDGKRALLKKIRRLLSTMNGDQTNLVNRALV